MKLEDAIIRLEILLKDKCECPECIKNKEAYKTVLEELNNLQEKNQTLVQYIGSQGMINDYLRYKNTKNRSCK